MSQKHAHNDIKDNNNHHGPQKLNMYDCRNLPQLSQLYLFLCELDTSRVRINLIELQFNTH